MICVDEEHEMEQVVVATCGNLNCPSKVPRPGWPEAKTILATLRFKDRGGHLIPYYRCLWCDRPAIKVEGS